MKVQLHTRGRMVVAAICGVALGVGMAMRARADQWDKRTILTINQPIQVTDKLLEPGQYVFKLLDSSSNRHIVQIFNSDQSHLIDTILAIPNYRLQATGGSRFAFWETPAGNAQALRAWFYPGDNFGQEFPYPKHPVVLKASAAIRPAEPNVAPLPAPEPQAVPEPAAQPTAEQPPAKPEEPVEVAQSTPPQPPPAPAPAPAPEAQPAPPTEPAELPHTASPFPLIGLAGLGALGLSGLLRWKRLS